MRPISERKSLERLDKIVADLRSHISNTYEHRAKSCSTCETPGACCLDAHFVNVRISRLEAVAINKFIDAQPGKRADEIRRRIDRTIIDFDLTLDAEHENKFACPLFEKGIGCLVHDVAKPIPCIVHACYESAADLPPSATTETAELAINRLNTQTYRRPQPQLPIPLAIKLNNLA